MLRYSLTPVLAPSVEPVSLGEAKDHCKIDPDLTEDDVLLEGIIIAARQLCETQTHRCLITQTWIVGYDSVATAGAIDIPLSPVQAVLGITYYDQLGVLITLDPLLYEVDLSGIRARVRPVWGTAWPITGVHMSGFKIQVRAGYGDAATAVPRALRIWMLSASAAMYESRTLTRDINELRVGGLMNSFLDGLLDPYRIIEI